MTTKFFKPFLTFMFIFVGSALAMAQSKYEQVMAETIAKLHQAKTSDDYTVLANDFARIANKETDAWLPPYYAALAYLSKGRTMMGDPAKLSELDGLADAADDYIAKADVLFPNNAEVYILKKMTHSLRMMVNPMERYQTEMPKAEKALAMAQSLSPDNPRITLLKAEDTYFTPEQFGGSKEKGMELFKKALEQFNIFKLKSSLHPNWGKAEAEYFVNKK